MKKIVLPLVLIFVLLTSTIAFAAGSLNLPAYPVSAQYGPWPMGTNSTMDVTLSGVGAGFDVTDGTYAAWCVQDHVVGVPTFDETVTLYSSDDPNMPADALGLPWDKINYVLNHKQGDKFDIQTAIWLLLGEQNPDWGVSPTAAAMVADANANGVGFVPQPGQIIAVVLYSDGFHFDPYTIQEVIIEVIVPGDEGGPGTGTPGYWKNHPEAWPVDSITIGEDTYSKQQAIDLMTQGEAQEGKSADKSLTLFRAYVAAYLNGLIGNETSCVDGTMANAYAWLNQHEPGSQVAGKSDAWKVGEPLYLTLDDYNNGLLCADARD